MTNEERIEMETHAEWHGRLRDAVAAVHAAVFEPREPTGAELAALRAALALPPVPAPGMKEIRIHPSPTADTRTCDWATVSKETLYQSSVQHIADVAAGMRFFAAQLMESARRHDHDKLSAIDHFHADFRTGFKETGWWDLHRLLNRHHLTQADGIPCDVNLIDVLDHIVDCVMAGMARSGSVTPLSLPPDLLARAFQNTVDLLKAQVVVEPSPSGRDTQDNTKDKDGER